MTITRRLRPAPWQCAPLQLLEPLEPRALLSPTPLPNPADMEDTANPVIRLSTSLGDIDIELLENEIPAIVNGFFAGLERGTDADQTFFHRLLPGRALQGGLFGYFGDIWASPVCEPIEDPVGPGRANTARTVAMGRLIDSGSLGTTTFIFNLADNTNFDPVHIVVFARVLDDRSWAVVQAIAALPVANLAGDAPFAGFFAGAFTQVPVTAPYDPGDPNDPDHPPQTVTPDLLVQTYDLQILKAPGASDFYRATIYGPEGFLDPSIHEFVPIENPSDLPVYYELTSRFEIRPNQNTGGQIRVGRDFTIERSVIPPHSRAGVTLQVRTYNSGNLRLGSVPFAMELRSTLPLAAALSHYDFGNTIAQPFSDEISTSWLFPDVRKAADIFDFLVWYNPGSDNATVTVTLTGDDGLPLAPITFSLEHYRRGGISLQGQPSIPDGVYTVRVDSPQPIAISRSHYAGSGPPRDRPEGFSQNGFAGVPSVIGVVPIAAYPGELPVDPGIPTLTLSVYNPGPDPAVVDIELYGSGEQTPTLSFPAALTVPPGAHATFSHALPQDVAGSLVYRATVPVFASYSMLRSEAAYGGAVAIAAATDVHFAEGFIDPARVASNVLEEAIYIFNPNSTGLGAPATTTAHVTYTLRFTDGSTLLLDQTVLGGLAMLVQLSSVQAILDQANLHGQYYFSIQVASDIPVVAQMLHTDVSLGGPALSGGGFVTFGTIFGQRPRLDDLPG